MKTFGIAFRLWGGTILLMSAFNLAWAVINLDVEILTGGFVVMVGSIVVTLPLMLTTNVLINISAKLPYRVLSRNCWLGFVIAVQNLLYIELIAQILGGSILDAEKIGVVFLANSIAALFVMVYFSKASFRKLYSQQAETTMYEVNPHNNGRHYTTFDQASAKSRLTNKKITNK